MLPASVRHQAGAEFTSFVDELARNPDLDGLLSRLRRGHHPDGHGWCGHPSHTYRWERYPCSCMRLADLVEQRTRST
jgi:hypothetical protein